MGRLVWIFMLVAALFGGAIFGLYKMRVDIPSLNTSTLYAHLDSLSVHVEQLKGRIVGQHESNSHKHEGEAHHEEHKITVTSPIAKDVIITQQFVCQIHSRQHIDVCALEDGYLNSILIKEGQRVKEDEVMFETLAILYKAEWEAAVAEKNFAEMELSYSKTLAAKNGISANEVALFKAKLAKAQAKLDAGGGQIELCQGQSTFRRHRRPPAHSSSAAWSRRGTSSRPCPITA